MPTPSDRVWLEYSHVFHAFNQYSIGAPFKPHSRSSARCISEQLLTRRTPIVPMVTVAQAGSRQLGRVVEQLRVAAHNKFLKSLFF